MLPGFLASDDEVREVDTIRAALPKGLTLKQQDYNTIWSLDDIVHKAMTKVLANNRKHDRDAAIHAMRLAIHHLESVNKRETT